MSLQDTWRRWRLAGHSREIGVVSGGLAALVVTSLALGSFVLRVNDLVPATGATIRPDTDIEVHFFGLPYGGKVHLDGREIPAQLSVSGQNLRCHVKGLPEGSHTLQVELYSPLKKIESVSQFVVDSTPPILSLESSRGPLLVAKSRYSIHGRSEPLATVALLPQGGASGDRPVPQIPTDSQGNFILEAELKAGWNGFVVQARDRAGNASEQTIRIFNDSQAPEVRLERVSPDPEKKGEGIKLDGHVSERNKARLRLVAHDDSGRVTSARWSIDGGPFKALPLKRDSKAPANAEMGPETEYKSEWVVDNLPEGDCKITCNVSDKAGRTQNVTATFTVDSSEKLGERPLRRGAKGADVEQLQQKLVDLGNLEESACSGVFDEATEQAVQAYQEAQGYKVSGILDGETLQSLGPRIFVNLALCSLVLDRPGQELKRYGVADGAASFPTPRGRYKITYKEKNPTWMPPDSPWAREAKAIPPGPGNPLGTRWIGLDSSAVGIHGTNADWSIGTHASHGCLRMHIPEVEQLYEMVEPGMPVIIYGGYEKNADIERYWPATKPKV